MVIPVCSYLYCEKEEIEVEVAGQDIFVGRGHEDTAEAIGQDGHHRVVGSRRSHWRSRASWSSIKVTIGLLLAHLNSVVSLLLVGHCEWSQCCAGRLGMPSVGCRGTEAFVNNSFRLSQERLSRAVVNS